MNINHLNVIIFVVNDKDLNLVNDPTITVSIEYDEIQGERFTSCRPYYTFTCGVMHTDNTVFIEVQWYANRDPILGHTGIEAISYHDLPTSIDSDFLVDNDYKIGTRVRLIHFLNHFQL